MKGRLAVPLAALAAICLSCGRAPTGEGAGSGTDASTKPRPAPSRLAARVREEFLHAWRAYDRHAWGHDEVKPVTRRPRDWYGESLLMTPVDALDTLVLMGLDAEADRARALIHQKLSFDRDILVKNFEITIRLLGGLLSAHQMTGDPKLLALAEDLGTRLLPAFDSPTGMPYMFVNLRTGRTNGKRSNPAEIGTLILEFGTLARLTNKPVFYDKAKRALVELYARRSPIGLVGEEIDVETGEWTRVASHVGGGIDSYYEYLVKCALLFGDADCERMARESLLAVNERLADETPTGLWYGQVDMETGRRTATEFGALHAFLPGVLALSGDVPRAARLQESCGKMWELHGLEPELLDYRTMRIVDSRYPLRPEIMESAWYLSRATKDPKYVAMGETFFRGLVERCRILEGYTVVEDVASGRQGDLTPSYFLAETLKYLYLLFSDGEAPQLEGAVLNTEAHPLRRTW